MIACKTCRFYVPMGEGGSAVLGHCRRYPPTPIYSPGGAEPDADEHDQTWPEVYERLWCGEHKARPGKASEA